MKHVLFVCSKNRWRSPTAERVFSSWAGIEVMSAGLTRDAVNPVTSELLEWADLIFVMEQSHRSKLSKQFQTHLKSKQIVCLDIPDEYQYMDPALIDLLKGRVPRFLPDERLEIK